MGESAMPINRSTVEHRIARERERERVAFPVKTIATNPHHATPPSSLDFPKFPSFSARITRFQTVRELPFRFTDLSRRITPALPDVFFENS